MKQRHVLLLLVVLLVLGGCGGSVNPGTSPGTPTSANLAALHVARSGSHLAPLNKTVNDASDVQRLYTAALALPVVSGTLNCPKDTGQVYQLEFLHGSDIVEHMKLDATGCQLLHIGQSDVRRTDASFLSLFEGTVGIPSLTVTIPIKWLMARFGASMN